MKYHLIVGFGKWSKKNLKYLKNNKIIKNIIIKTRDKYFDFYKKKELKNNELSKIFKNLNSVHICSPPKNHFASLKKFHFCKKMIVEKPFLENTKQLTLIKKLYKKKFFIVNYIDTFNPLLSKVINHINKKKFDKIVFNYSKTNKYYKEKYDFANEWLDHPLSLILLLIGNFSKFQIEKFKIKKKDNYYNNNIIINYNYKNFKIIINFNMSKIIQRNICIYNGLEFKKYHLYKNSVYQNNKKIFQSNKNSFDCFYNSIKKKIKYPAQNFRFHEKIILERQNIIKKIVSLK